MTTLDRAKEDFIKVLEHERAKFDAVIRQVRALQPVEADDAAKSSKKLSGDWAEEVLRARKNAPAHYRDIARDAVSLGYVGVKRPNEPIGSQPHLDRIAHSFSGTLCRERNRFEAIGGGRYRLRHYQDN